MGSSKNDFVELGVARSRGASHFGGFGGGGCWLIFDRFWCCLGGSPIGPFKGLNRAPIGALLAPYRRLPSAYLGRTPIRPGPPGQFQVVPKYPMLGSGAAGPIRANRGLLGPKRTPKNQTDPPKINKNYPKTPPKPSPRYSMLCGSASGPEIWLPGRI